MESYLADAVAIGLPGVDLALVGLDNATWQLVEAAIDKTIAVTAQSTGDGVATPAQSALCSTTKTGAVPLTTVPMAAGC